MNVYSFGGRGLFPGVWILCADVSAHKIQTPGNRPKEIIQYIFSCRFLNYKNSSVKFICLWVAIAQWGDLLRVGWSGDRIPVGSRFPAHVQTGPVVHLASCAMGTGSFPRVKRPGFGFDHPPPSCSEFSKESRPVLGWPLPLQLSVSCCVEYGAGAAVQEQLSATDFELSSHDAPRCFTNKDKITGKQYCVDNTLHVSAQKTSRSFLRT